MNKLKLAIAVGCGLCFSSIAQAEMKWNGYTSLVAGTNLSDGESYDGYVDGTIDFKRHSVVGLQATADVPGGVKIVAQVVMKGSNDFELSTDWLYASYDLTEEQTVRFGRMRSAFYKYSDYLDVGLAYHWITPPREAYTVNFHTIDGFGYNYESSFKGVDFIFDFAYGKYDESQYSDNLEEDIVFQLDNYSVTSMELAKGDFALRYAYVASDLSILSPTLDGAYELLNDLGLSQAAEDYRASDDDGRFKGLAFTYDNGSQFFVSESTSISGGRTFFAKVEGWYSSLGHRSGSFVYHLTYGEEKTHPSYFVLNSIPDDSPVYGLFNGSISNQKRKTKTTTAGVRYNLSSNSALKFELSDVDDTNSPGTEGKGTLFKFGLAATF